MQQINESKPMEVTDENCIDRVETLSMILTKRGQTVGGWVPLMNLVTSIEDLDEDPSTQSGAYKRISTYLKNMNASGLIERRLVRGDSEDLPRGTYYRLHQIASDEPKPSANGKEGGGGLVVSAQASAAKREQYAAARQRLTDQAEYFVTNLPDELGIDQVGQLVSDLEMRAHLHEDGKHITRFLMGIVARRMKEAKGHGTIMELYQQLSERWQINENTLRYCVAIAEKYQDNVLLFDRWLQAGNFPKRFYHMKKLVQKDIDISDPEKAARRVVDQVQKLADEAGSKIPDFKRKKEALLKKVKGLKTEVEELAKEGEGINEVVKQIEYLSEDVESMVADEEAEGAVVLLSDTARRFRDIGLKKLFEEGDREGALKAYDQFLRELPSLATGEADVELHHIETGGAGMKGSEWAKIPLTHDEHMLLHNEGFKAFRHTYGVDVRDIMLRVWHLFLAGEDIDVTKLSR